jgi:phosphatidylglycerophosphate synthase
VSFHFPEAPEAQDAQDGIADQSALRDTRRNEFVVALLTDLQRRHYSPAAWWRFLADSWCKSRATAQEHSMLSRSWVSASLVVVVLAACSFSAAWLFEGGSIALRVLPALVLGLILQQGDVYIHLGLNWRPADGFFREHLGIPTLLTLARGVMANLLLAHLLSGSIPLPSVVLGIYLIGIATDIADGQIARCTNWQTRLGGNLDGEADLFLSSATILCTLFSGVLPAWVAVIMLLRFAVPLVGALLSYFVAIRQIDFTHTLWGKVAGAAQAALLIALLAPKVFARMALPLYPPLLLLTLALLVAAPIVEIRKNVASWRLQKREIRSNAG